MVRAYALIGYSGACLDVLRCFMSRFSRVYGVAGRVLGGQGCLGRDACGSGRRRQAATRASTTPERRADAGVVSLCHTPTVATKGETPSGRPPALFTPLASPTSMWPPRVPSHTGAKRLKVKN